LLVEDDADTRELVACALAADGFEVEAYARAKAAERAVAGGDVGAIVLDVSLPDANGLDVCREWRRTGADAPILMLTARCDVSSRVAGLDAGADDYLTKPFAVAELRARLRALVRRSARRSVDRVFKAGAITIDFERRQAWVGQEEVPLTRRELDVAARLVRGAGGVVARKELLADLWGERSADATASLEVILARLRRKLERGGRGSLIRTVRGIGYAIQSPDVES